MIPSGYARFFSQTASDTLESWFWRIQDEWRELRGEKVSPGFETFLARTVADPLYVSPVPWSYAWTREIGFVLPVHALWRSIPITREGESSGFYRLNAESEARARERLLSQYPPSAILFEGSRVSGFWLLKEPLNDTEAARMLGIKRPRTLLDNARAGKIPGARQVNDKITVFSERVLTRWLPGKKP